VTSWKSGSPRTLRKVARVLLLANVNNAVLSSSTLEHEMTERPFKVRLFCSLKNALLDAPRLWSSPAMG
jgi:hypothetical protein